MVSTSRTLSCYLGRAFKKWIFIRVGVLFVFELSEVEVLCTKDQSEEILERIIDRRLSAVKADENPGDIQFRGFQPPSVPNRVGFSASRSVPSDGVTSKG